MEYILKEITKDYSFIDRFSDGLAPAWAKEGVGFIDTDGNEVIACIFERYSYEPGASLSVTKYGFFEGRSPVKQNNKWGMINKNGYLVIPCEWDELLRMVGNRIIAMRGGKWGVLDRGGKTVIPLIYDSIQLFSEERTFAMNKESII